jgi:transposase InsO family protein
VLATGAVVVVSVVDVVVVAPAAGVAAASGVAATSGVVAGVAAGVSMVGGATGFPHSTVSKVLRRAGISRRPRAATEPANRYEWPRPGDLLHMDTSRYARFLRPGHRVTGDRSQSLRGRSKKALVGYDFAHAVVDDHSRLAYVELHRDEKADTVTAFLERALTFYESHGITAKRLMTDNAFAYVNNHSLRELARRRVRHLTTQPYRPRTNGKVERFHQTMAREWAYGLAYRSHQHRNTALPHWLDNYNRRRPHSSIGDRPPISRIHNVRR